MCLCNVRQSTQLCIVNKGLPYPLISSSFLPPHSMYSARSILKPKDESGAYGDFMHTLQLYLQILQNSLKFLLSPLCNPAISLH